MPKKFNLFHPAPMVDQEWTGVWPLAEISGPQPVEPVWIPETLTNQMRRSEGVRMSPGLATFERDAWVPGPLEARRPASLGRMVGDDRPGLAMPVGWVPECLAAKKMETTPTRARDVLPYPFVVASAAPPSVTQSCTANNQLLATNLVFTWPASTTAGDYLYAAIGTLISATVTTPAGWTLLQSVALSATVKLWIYGQAAAAAQTSQTFILSATHSAVGVAVDVNGLAIGTPDRQNTNTGTGTTATTGSTGVLSHANEIVLAAVAVTAGSLAVGTAWVAPFVRVNDGVSTNGIYVDVGVDVVSATTALNASHTNASLLWGAAINSFE